MVFTGRQQNEKEGKKKKKREKRVGGKIVERGRERERAREAGRERQREAEREREKLEKNYGNSLPLSSASEISPAVKTRHVLKYIFYLPRLYNIIKNYYTGCCITVIIIPPLNFNVIGGKLLRNRLYTL